MSRMDNTRLMMSMPEMARPPQMAMSGAVFNKELLKKQESIVSQFASSLGTGEGANTRDLTTFLGKSLTPDAVVCTIPSLDMKLEEDQLPSVGEHRKELMNLTGGQGKSDGATPVMEASILSSTSEASADAAVLEQKAAQRLCTKTSWTKSTVSYAPHALSKNVAEAFSSLVDSRVRAWTLLLFRHSLSSGDSASRSRLLSMLSASIKVNSTLTSLKTLPLPESASGQPKEADVILPLLFEVQCSIELQHRTDKVTLRAPGTVSGNFLRGLSGEPTMELENINVNLDTGALLNSMIDQARLAVFKTVAKVTSNDVNTSKGAPKAPEGASAPPAAAAASPAAPPKTSVKPVLSASALSSFSSSLRMTSRPAAESSPAPGGGGEAPRLEKARKSALRLDSVLHGKSSDMSDTSNSLVGSRKNRSVQWDHPMQIPQTNAGPSSKRLRMAHTSARLKSFKSFGRPHAGDFGSGPKNATFGNFGGGGATWGRDGRMVHTPSPMESMRQDIFSQAGAASSVNRNESFSLSSRGGASKKPTLTRNPLLGSSGRLPTQQGGMQRLPSTLPRTATALESWLVKATSGK